MSTCFILYDQPATGKEMLRFLQENGWVIARITGSHHHMRKDGATVIVAIHGKQEIPKGTQAAILKKAGLR